MVYYKKWIVVITATTLVYALNGWHALEVIQLHSGRFGLKDKYLYINLMPNLKSCKVWACVKTSICWFLYPFTKTEAHPAESATPWKLKSDGEVGVKGSLCLTQHESNLNTVCFCSFFPPSGAPLISSAVFWHQHHRLMSVSHQSLLTPVQ